MRTIYIADFRYGKANLTKARLIKETPKTLFLKQTDDIMGWVYIPTRLSKKKHGFFFSRQEALAYLAQQAEKYVKGCKEKLNKAIQERDRLRQIIEEGKEGEHNETN